VRVSRVKVKVKKADKRSTIPPLRAKTRPRKNLLRCMFSARRHIATFPSERRPQLVESESFRGLLDGQSEVAVKDNGSVTKLGPFA
jgi:hypothetical protein